MRVYHVLGQVLFWAVAIPLSIGLTLVQSIPQLVLAGLYALELSLDLAWLLVAVVFHLLRSSLYALGIGDREKALLIRSQARHFAGELAADVRKFAGLPVDVVKNFRKSLRQIGSLFDNLSRKLPPLKVGNFARPFRWARRDRLSFEKDYEVVERLASGGSTAQLFVVRPRNASRRIRPPENSSDERLVIKYFDLRYGSHLENIVRESGAVKLAKKLGLALDSYMGPKSFYYVMPYYHGSTLTREILAFHRELAKDTSPSDSDLRRFLLCLKDLLNVVVAYHKGGVFHKDIKPDNLIVSGDRLVLVDIGLLTPLESTLQLTTHGTEYFRDPEMVRLATRGVSIRDVDCAKFDIYSIGAVLYFMVEGEFPSSGSLSRYSRPAPFCLQWICNRAMTDFDKRYAATNEMLQDVDDLLNLSQDMPFESIKVSSLSSFREENSPEGDLTEDLFPVQSTIKPGEVGDDPDSPERPYRVEASSAAQNPRARTQPRGRFGVFARSLLLVTMIAGGALLVYPRWEEYVGLSESTGFFPALARNSEGSKSALELSPSPSSPSGEAGADYRRFGGRIQAVEWAARAIDKARQESGISDTPLLLRLPDPGEHPETREFLRELKLALAHRGLAFETLAEEYGRRPSEDASSDLRIETIQVSSVTRVELTLHTSGRHWKWFVEY